MATIQEMHLQIDLELNKLNSNLYDIVLSQEKDYFLNKAQERFIKQRYSAKSNSKGVGFEMSQKRIDDLKNLLVPNYYDRVFKLANTDFDFTNKGKFYFPDDYMFLTSNRSKITYNPCGTITVTQGGEFFEVIVFNLPNVDNYSVVKVKLGATQLLGTVLNGLGQLEKTLAIQTIADTLKNNSTYISADWKIYTNNFRGIKGDIIFWKGTGTLTTSIDNGITYITPTTSTPNPTLYQPTYYYNVATGTQSVIPNRFAQQDDVYVMQQDPFNKTNVLDGPLTIIHTNSIDVFFDPNIFIVNEIAISYLRKPKLMSLTINQSCELDEETHAEILRDAVNLLLENFEAEKRLSTSLMVEATNE
jgi:hypothetical protein